MVPHRRRAMGDQAPKGDLDTTMIPETRRPRKTQSIKKSPVTRRARQLYAYIHAHGPVTREQAMRAVCGDAYTTVPWRVHFCTLLYGARAYAAQFDESIVTVGKGRHRPLRVVEAPHA